MTDARQWIGALGGRLSVQAALLESLLSAAEDDDRWEWLELSCSVANGRGDELSDLDVGLGHRGGVAPPTDEVTQLVSGFGDVVEVSVQPWDCFTRWWVQYADGGQLDLVVMPAAHRPGRAPNSVALLDRSGVLAEEFTPKAWAATPEEPGYWLLDGWEALSNVAKYVRRGAVFEGIEQVHRARTAVFQLWAVGEHVAYPSFGLTSLLDDEHAQLPEGIEATYPLARQAQLLEAALATAAILRHAGHHARPELDTPLADYVITRLRVLSDTSCG